MNSDTQKLPAPIKTTVNFGLWKQVFEDLRRDTKGEDIPTDDDILEKEDAYETGSQCVYVEGIISISADRKVKITFDYNGSYGVLSNVRYYLL